MLVDAHLVSAHCYNHRVQTPGLGYVVLHLAQPAAQGLKADPVANVEDEDDSLRVLVEFGANL